MIRNVLANVADMISYKDATVKQVTLNVTDMHKINSHSHSTSCTLVLEVSSFSKDTRSKSSSPLVNSLVKNWLFKAAPPHQTSVSCRFNSSTLWFCPAWLTRRCVTAHVCSNLFHKTLSLVFGAIPFWSMRVFDQNLIVVAKTYKFT